MEGDDEYDVLHVVGKWANANSDHLTSGIGCGLKLVEKYERENGGYLECRAWFKEEITKCVDLPHFALK